MDQKVKDFLLAAKSKALATLSAEGELNVIPVSTLKIVGDDVVLVNYFMKKTLQNILAHPSVALSAWIDMEGYQIKGVVDYQTEGALVDEIRAWAGEHFPERTVSGVLVIKVHEVFSVTP